MTPLVQKAVQMAPKPEQWMWFDVGQMKFFKGEVPEDVVMRLPFPKVGIVGLDEVGAEFALWMTQGDGSVTVGGASLWEGLYMWPFAYISTDAGIHYYSINKEAPASQHSIKKVFTMVASVLIKLADQGGTGYQCKPQNTFLNRKRAAKGKPPLSFDWTTVVIEPPQPKVAPQGGTHAPPRWHERRGHWRTTRTGKRVWVRNCEVGDKARGAVFHDYKINPAG